MNTLDQPLLCTVLCPTEVRYTMRNELRLRPYGLSPYGLICTFTLFTFFLAKVVFLGLRATYVFVSRSLLVLRTVHVV